MDVDNIESLIRKNNISVVRFEVSDVYGIAHTRAIRAKHFREKATNGLNFAIPIMMAFDPAGSLVEGTGYGNEVGCGDSVAFPILNTFKILPWAKQAARVLVEPTMDDIEVVAYPRIIARRQLERLKEVGLSIFSAHEYEFYVVNASDRQPINSDRNFGATARLPTVERILDPIVEYLPQVGVDIESIETECGPGQLELSYKPAFGIQAADNAHTHKTSIKEIARQKDYMASFMSKPYPNEAGNSAHYNHSLWDAEGKVPKLYDSGHPTGLSEIGRHWIAGILAHVPGLAILMAPTVNCLTRFKPHIFVPVNATWGYDNRSTALRIKLNGERGTYIENRIAAGGCNPYISLAATVAAGLDGIINKLELPPAVKFDAADKKALPPNTAVASIPTNLHDALTALVADKVLTDALGPEFMKCFLAHKKNEENLQMEAKAAGSDSWDYDFFFEYL